MADRVIATRLNPHKTISGTANTAHMSRVRHTCAAAGRVTRIGFANFYCGSSQDDTDGPNSITVKCGIEVAGGTITPLTFSGASSKSVAPGTIEFSDPISISVAAGDLIWSRTYVTVSATQRWPLGLVTNTGGVTGEGVELDGSDKTTSGTVTGSTSFAYSPALILGTPSTNAPAIFCIGDSIGNGSNDALGTFDRTGFLFRTFENTLPGRNFTNYSISAKTALATAATNALRRRLALWAYFTHAIVQLGVNDMAATGAGSLVTDIEGHLTTIYQAIAAAGVQKIYQTTITPRTTSSDSWATTGNQTIYATPADWSTKRLALNTWIRGTPSPLAGYFEIADTVETSRGSGIWKAPSYTSDGIHPITAGHVDMAAAISLSTFNLPSPKSSRLRIGLGLGL